jgi:hypothetical protein
MREVIVVKWMAMFSDSLDLEMIVFLVLVDVDERERFLWPKLSAG